MINRLPFPSFFITVALLVVVFVFFLVFVMIYHQIKRQEYKAANEAMRQERNMDVVRARIEEQEATMKRIATALHDNIGQQLQVLKLQAERLSAIGNATPDAGIFSAHETLLDEVILHTRKLSHLLNSQKLVTHGVIAEIEKEVFQLQVSTSLNCSFAVVGIYEPQPRQVEELLLKTAKEGIQNTIKHSGATHLFLKLELSAGALVLTVRDNGRGFLLNKGEAVHEGIGLDSIGKEAALLGAKLSIQAEPGKGTLLSLSIRSAN